MKPTSSKGATRFLQFRLRSLILLMIFCSLLFGANIYWRRRLEAERSKALEWRDMGEVARERAMTQKVLVEQAKAQLKVAAMQAKVAARQKEEAQARELGEKDAAEKDDAEKDDASESLPPQKDSLSGHKTPAENEP